jgi:hypothetical protein
MKPFTSTITQLPLKLINSGVNTIQFSPITLCPELQVANQYRQFKLLSVTARFYPNVVVGETAAYQPISVQLLMSDLATNTQVPATPIVPLSLTNPTRLRSRAVGPRWISSNAGSGENIFGIAAITSIANYTITVDLQATYLLSRDGLSPPPAALMSEVTYPDSPILVSSASSTAGVVKAIKRLGRP